MIGSGASSRELAIRLIAELRSLLIRHNNGEWHGAQARFGDAVTKAGLDGYVPEYKYRQKMLNDGQRVSAYQTGPTWPLVEAIVQVCCPAVDSSRTLAELAGLWSAANDKPRPPGHIDQIVRIDGSITPAVDDPTSIAGDALGLARLQVKQLESALATDHERADDLGRQLEQARRNEKRAREQLDEQSVLITELQREHRDTHRHHQEVVAARDRLATANADVQHRLAALQQRYQELTAVDLDRSRAVSSMQGRVGTLVAEVERLRGELDDRDRALERSSEANTALQTTTLRLRHELDQLVAEVRQLRERVGDDPDTVLAQDDSTLDSALDDLLDSTHDATSGTDADWDRSERRPVRVTGRSVSQSARRVAHPRLRARRLGSSALARRAGTASPASSPELIPGVDNAAVEAVVEDVAWHRYLYDSLSLFGGDYPHLPRHAVLEVYRAAHTPGRGGPSARGSLPACSELTEWRPRRSGFDPAGLVPILTIALFLLELPITLLMNTAIKQEFSWGTWAAVHLIFLSGVGVLAVPYVRRFLVSLFLLPALALVCLYVGANGPEGSTVGGGPAVNIAFSVLFGTLLILAARSHERFYDELARYAARQRDKPNPALVELLHMRARRRDEMVAGRLAAMTAATGSEPPDAALAAYDGAQPPGQTGIALPGPQSRPRER